MPTIPGIVAQLQALRDDLAAQLKVADEMLAAARKKHKAAPQKSGETFVCPECGKEFSSKGALGGHRSLKHGIKGQSRKARKAREGKQVAPVENNDRLTPEGNTDQLTIR